MGGDDTVTANFHDDLQCDNFTSAKLDGIQLEEW